MGLPHIFCHARASAFLPDSVDRGPCAVIGWDAALERDGGCVGESRRRRPAVKQSPM